MGRSLQFERIGTTEDTNDPVVEARIPESGSFLQAIVTDDRSTIRVWLVESRVKGDMKRILDEMVRQLDTREVHFLEPDVGNIGDRVEYSERVREQVYDPVNDEQITSTYLRCEWVPDGA